MQRTVHAFQIHAHIQETALEDYRQLFRRIKSIPAKKRRQLIEERVITLSAVEMTKDFVIITAQDGDKNVKPLLYDTATNEERIGEKEANEVVSVRTHAVVDLRTRFVAVEYNHRGAKASHLHQILSQLSLEFDEYKRITIEMPPLVGSGFLAELQKYGRIRMASVEMVRPNFDWDDCVDPIMAVAGQSEAQKIEVSFFAQPKESLSKSRGIVGSVIKIIHRGKAIFHNIILRGMKEGERAETTLKLRNHTEQRKIEVSASADDGHPVPGEVIQGLMKYLNDLRENSQIER
jgi:hypothetical protein